jgi:anti-sigma factor RsiW
MNDTTPGKHVGNLASYYVLGLLAPEQKRTVSRHIGECVNCRQLVAAEKQIGLLVRSTIEASGPGQAQLSSLMPDIPANRPGWFSSVTIRQQVAIAGIVLVTFFAGLNLISRQEMGGFSAPISTAYVATASHTHTPTSATGSPTPILGTNEITALTINSSSLIQPLITPAPRPVDAR